MRRIARIPRPVERTLEQSRRPSFSPTVCTACQLRAAPFSTTARRDAEKGEVPFTEKIRRRIWGTEHAPGREDPYSRESPMRPIVEENGRPDIQAKPVKTEKSKPSSTYKQATTWDGLEWIGGKKWLEEQEQIKKFGGFLPVEKASSPNDISAALRRSLVEVFTARAENRSLWSRTEPQQENWSVKYNIRPSEDGNDVVLEQKSVDQPHTTDANVAEQIELSPEEIQVLRSISLRDPEIRFAVIKRVMQLTGIHIPDPAIAEIDTAGILLNKLSKPEKPKKLAEKLESNTRLARLSNVKVYERRVTPIDKEKEVGRWKVIEQALLDRNLPVTGHNV